MALEDEKITSDVFNVGSGIPISLNGILELLSELTGKEKIKPQITEKYRVGDNRHDFSDITKIKKTLNFKPKCEITNGLRKLVEWGETQEAVDKFNEAERERVKYLEG